MGEHSRPTPFLNYEGEPELSWFQWYSLFENYQYMEAKRERKRYEVAGRQVPDELQTSEDKNRTLFSLLGSIGQRRFLSLPNAGNYDRPHAEFVADCERLFKKDVNYLVGISKFQDRKQQLNESIDEYLLALRLLARDCAFGEREDFRIAVQLAIGCFGEETKIEIQKDCPPADQLSVNVVMNKLRLLENAKKNVSELSSRSSQVGATKTTKTKPTVQKKPASRSFQKPKSFEKKQSITCFRCGEPDHISNQKDKCKAFGKVCTKCQKMNHFAKCCQSKEGIGMLSSRIASISEKLQSTLNVWSSTSKKIPVKFVIDTGSDVTAITKQIYEQYFKDQQLLKDDPLLNFDNSEIRSVLGSLTLSIEFKDSGVQTKVYVVSNSCFSVLGLNAIRQLGLNLNASSNSIWSLTKHDWQKEFSDLGSESLGKVPNFEHKIRLKEGYIPIAQKLRPIPIHRKQLVEDELEAQEANGVIEKCLKSEWAHPLVAVMKPNTDKPAVRICGDLTELNPFVIPERFPLPHIKELYTQLQGAKFYTKLDLTKAYWHIELAPESRELTAFLMPKGLFQWKRLPMGLKDSASVFQRMMQTKVLAGLEGVIVCPLCLRSRTLANISFGPRIYPQNRSVLIADSSSETQYKANFSKNTTLV